jgi:membrane fusion protein, multidrug efflux system
VSSSNPILTIAVPDPLKAMVNIPESDVSMLRVGTPARLEIDAYPARTFEGKIVRLNSALEASSRTLIVEIEVPNKDQLLKPGMFARVSLVLGEHKDSLLVPDEAVMNEEGRHFVYTVEEGRAKKLAVKAGWLQDSQREILEGIDEGKQIVVAGQHRLKNGTRVRVLTEGEAGDQGDGKKPAGEGKRKGKRKAERAEKGV